MATIAPPARPGPFDEPVRRPNVATANVRHILF